jgi:hypothetical protein
MTSPVEHAWSMAPELGSCFRCDRSNLQVIRIGEIVGPEGITPLFACAACTDRLIVMHQRAHESVLRRYAVHGRAHPL